MQEDQIRNSKAAEENELNKQALENKLIEVQDREEQLENQMKKIQSQLPSTISQPDKERIEKQRNKERQLLEERNRLAAEREQRLLVDREKKRKLEQSVCESKFFCMLVLKSISLFFFRPRKFLWHHSPVSIDL